MRWETRLLGMVTAALLVFGIAATYGAASLTTLQEQSTGLGFALRQLSGAVMGGALLLLASRLDYYRWRQLAWPLLLVTIVVLLIPLLPFTRSIAPSINGARRWIDIGPINFQPSEVARLVVVIWCAMLASKKGLQVREFKKGVLPFVLILALVSVLILLEPNLSMATLVALLGGLVLFTSGAKIGHFGLVVGVGMILIFHQIRDVQYRLARLVTFLNPGDNTTEAGFQIHQSLMGIGSGRLVGVGFGEGQQKLGYLFRFSFQHHRRGMGVYRRLRRGHPLRPVLLARVPDRPDRSRSLRAVSRRRLNRRHRAHRLHAHGGVAWSHSYNGPHAAIHVVRPVESGDLAAWHWHSHQHRTAPRESAGNGAEGAKERVSGGANRWGRRTEGAKDTRSASRAATWMKFRCPPARLPGCPAAYSSRVAVREGTSCRLSPLQMPFANTHPMSSRF
jgi:hypothetical protein